MKNPFRNIFLLAILSIITAAAQAQGSNADRAKAIAERLFAHKIVETRSSAPSLAKVWDSSILNNVTTRNSADEPTFHAFASTDGEGFVIVAEEREASPIIGYSFDDSLPLADELPEAFVSFLAEFDSEIRLSRANGATTRAAVTDKATLGNVVVELNTAKWAQGAPYNQLCPQKNGKNTSTGCIATAFAIIMRHHKWPKSGTGNVYNPVTGEKITLGHTYDWDNMPLEYYSGNYTEEQATEVATVMRDIGFAYGLDYGVGSTGGTENATKMRDNFGYNNLSELTGTSSGASQRFVVNNDAVWIQKMKASLDESCPIPYVATNKGTGSDAKHIFVIDGYTDSDYFHFNWGWGGYCNGYYSLAKMDPTASDDYSSQTTGHKAFFNLKPLVINYYTVTASIGASKGGTAAVNGSATVTVEEGTTVQLTATANEGYTFLNWSLNGEIVGTEATLDITATEDADYIANFEEKKLTISVISTIGGNATINGGDSTIEVKKGEEVTITATPDEGYHFDNWSVNNIAISTSSSYTFTVSEDITFTANFAVTSGINAINSYEKAIKYDLKGEIIGNDNKKGIFIIDGKKILIK
ncbi:MAG: C10 family peptidase [Bacteroidaceae bacterium]|nr:C10 family peptidase [Bacteroidaceae bacterium]